MPVEIRQLSIKVNISDQQDRPLPVSVPALDLERLKESLLPELIEEIQDYIEKNKER